MPGVPLQKDPDTIIYKFGQLTSNADWVQEQVLHSILEENSGTEYLQRHGLNGRTDPESFKSCLPLITHADIEGEVQRIADGDKSAILTSKPPGTLFLSSGTTKGKRKLIPMQDDFFFNSIRLFQISGAFREREFPIRENGKLMDIVYCGKQFTTKGGLKAGTGTTNYFRSEEFKVKQRATQTYVSSPPEVIFSSNLHHATYCHLLFGLLDASDIQFISSTFVYTIVEAFRFMEEHWSCLCDTIECGILPAWISDQKLRNLPLTPNPLLADFIRAECSRGFQGIIPRLWTKARYIYSIITGTMESYAPRMKYYAGELPLVPSDYGASETWVGVNVNPRSSPEKTTFTIVPDLAYFEFVPLKRVSALGMEDNQKLVKASSLFLESPPVSLSQVKVGKEYEIVVTTFGGLYRYRLGDVIRVTGFYNSSPQFQYVCRREVLLSIHIDKIGERDLQMVFSKASEKVLTSKRGLELVDYTTHADITTNPGHYVAFVELNCQAGKFVSKELDKILQEYCDCLDKSFVEPGYVLSRAANTIGPLELCVVESGTFYRLIQQAIDGGGTLNQYKTPRCVAAPKMLNTLRAGVVKRYYSV